MKYTFTDAQCLYKPINEQLALQGLAMVQDLSTCLFIICNIWIGSEDHLELIKAIHDPREQGGNDQL